jgi:hypothetical protein
VDAVPCELFSAANSLLTGKFTGNIVHLAKALGDKSPPESSLAEKTEFSRPIGTGNDQEWKQGKEFPDNQFGGSPLGSSEVETAKWNLCPVGQDQILV